MSVKMDAKKREQFIQVIYAVGGSLVYALGVNLIIIPMGLYSGGFMGIAQLSRTLIVSVLHVPVPAGVDLAGLIYFIVNIPLFYMGLRIMGKGFAIKTLLTVGIQSLFLVMVPIPAAPIIEDYLTACIIGGIVAGTGTGLVLRGRSSGGGQDIIGLCCAKKYPNFSVGKINIIMNIFVYGICLFLFNIEIVIYSLIFATVSALAIDRVHIQNINTSVMIFTKKQGISKAIMEQTGRGVTNWDGEGAYTNKTSYILFVMISKYEVGQIKQIVHSIDPHAFMIFTEGCSVEGNFEKRL
ncbi:YitT family protein [Bariatricus sp. SGI.154]|uniref:YitT family protein n=1 Tax=Bariatricus sp. SGI.154 TaxID=3420549 RepID=UPI003D0535AE